MTVADKPDVPPVQRAAIDKARRRHHARPVNPGVLVEPNEAGYHLAAPHRDREAWEVQILDAFGTRSQSVGMVFLDQLAALCRPAIRDDGQWSPNEVDLNAMLAMVTGARPRNEIEAALAAQMAATHVLTSRVFAEAALVDGWVNPEKAMLAAKLAGTFAKQVDTMNRLKGRTGKQSIKVKYERHNHQHVHMQPGGASEILDQARAPAALQCRNHSAALERAPLPGEDQIRRSVSGSRGEGEGEM